MKRLLCLAFAAAFFSCDPESDRMVQGWEKFGQHPVLQKGAPFVYDFYAISDGCVVFDQGIFKMWYTAGGANLPDETLRSRIAYATSADGVTWQKSGENPVMDVTDGGWDSIGVETAHVIIDEEDNPAKRYKMWYAGQSDEIKYEIGFAYSPDGVHWIKHPEPVLTVGNAGQWDNSFLEGPSVLKIGGQYKMWYTGYDAVVDGQASDGKTNIGYATSNDGIHWTKHPLPVLLASENGWDKIYVQDPSVLFYGGVYHMWYGGVDRSDHYGQQTGYAWSTDGISWTKSDQNPVLKRGNPGSWDANTASFPSVIINDGKLKMWYTGKDVEPLPQWPQPYFWEIGLAESGLGHLHTGN